MKISAEHKKLIPYVVGTTLGLIFLFSFGYSIFQAFQRNKSRPLTERPHNFSVAEYLVDLSNSFKGIQTKVTRIRNSAEENEKLRVENLNLKLTLDSIQYGCSEKAAKKNTEEFELKLSKETGTKVGRSLSGINYHAPVQLFPSQLYTLALAYVVAREDEKAAVLLTLLTGAEGNSTYKTSKNFLMAGVSWYRLENFILADYYFDEVLKTEEDETSMQDQAKARLWKALVAEKLQKRLKTQYWLKELVDHNPNSMESKWVNLTEEKNGTN